MNAPVTCPVASSICSCSSMPSSIGSHERPELQPAFATLDLGAVQRPTGAVERRRPLGLTVDGCAAPGASGSLDVVGLVGSSTSVASARRRLAGLDLVGVCVLATLEQAHETSPSGALAPMLVPGAGAVPANPPVEPCPPAPRAESGKLIGHDEVGVLDALDDELGDPVARGAA